MTIQLFYPEKHFIDIVGLRACARAEIEGSSLIQQSASGDRQAVIALHVGFWPFVREFELAIDRRKMPRQPLRRKFERSGQQDVATVNDVFSDLAREVKKMKEEEGSHAAHWHKDSKECGIQSLEAPLVDGVGRLIESAYVPDHSTFFSVLAGTEFIAEELSAYLVRHRPFTDLFNRRRWVWGEVHLIPHDDGPSHLDIDLDLARAYAASDNDAKVSVESAVKKTIAQFGIAAREVAATFVSSNGVSAY